MRCLVLLAAASLLVVGVGAAQPAAASIRRATNIPAQPLSVALRTLAKERGFEVLFRAELVRDMRSAGAVGEFTPEEALKQLLSGTGLTYRYLDEKTVTVLPLAALDSLSSNSPQEVAKEGKKNSSDEFRSAQVDQGASAGAISLKSSRTEGPSNEPIKLEEIVVTAQKRTERLLD